MASEETNKIGDKQAMENMEISDDQLLKLDNQICFALYVSSKEIIKKYKPLLEPLGLTYTGYIAMLALWEEDHVTVKALGQKLFLDSGTLTPLLKKMETKGYVKRHRSVEDERNVYISLTEEGKALKAKAVEVPKALMCAVDFDEGAAAALLKMLHETMPKEGTVDTKARQ